jgi:hypothetical protein
MKGLFFFDTTEDTIVRTNRGSWTVTFNGEERPERFSSMNEASTFLKMLQRERQ